MAEVAAGLGGRAGPRPPRVRWSVTSGVATIVLDSVANRNALSRQLVAELADALDVAAGDRGTRVVVLTGAGPVFCSGADLKEQQDGAGPGAVTMPEILLRILDHRCPVVARVNGPARAGGLGLMAACDIVVAPHSSSFAFTEVRLGVVPAIIAVPVLMRMDPTVAHEHFLTGEVFDAFVAERSGLVNRAVPDEDLDAVVDRYTAALLHGGPAALASTKQLRRTVPGEEPASAFARLQSLTEAHFASDEGRAGIAARLAKRAAPWASG